MTTDDQKIRCSKCNAEISIDEVLTRQIEAQAMRKFEAAQAKKEAELAQTKADLAQQQAALEAKKLQLDSERKAVEVEVNKKVADRINTQKAELWKQALSEAEKSKTAEVKMLQEQIHEQNKKIEAANTESLALRIEKQKVEAEKQEIELTVQRQMDEERNKIQEEAARKAAEVEQYKISQLEKKISDANKVNEELRRKLEQGSQQTQGEVLELELEEILKNEFPNDEIVPVPKGVNGADIIQTVKDRFGHACGQIAWESKKTKNWTEGWIQKLKDDQRNAKAELAVIVSAVLPDDVEGFKFRDGVWVCDIKLAVALASVLRSGLEAVSRERTNAQGKDEKMEVLYSYLTGVEFRQKMEAIAESFKYLICGLEKEKMAYQKIWAEREKQIQKAFTNTVTMYGNLSGYVPLQKIEMLELGEGEKE